jgi:hypothetical protein
VQTTPEQQRPNLAAYGYVPEPAELALIKAALRLDPLSPPALALAQLAAAGRTDRGVIRLLPLLRRRPELPPALREKVEQLYRASLVRFLELEEQLRQVTLALQRHEITPLLLKGYPLARYYYANPAFRPTSDLDVAVRPERFSDAMQVLQTLGYAPGEGRKVAVGPGTHGAHLRHAQLSLEVDLHRHVLASSRWDGADDGFWARALPCSVRGADALTLTAGDHLLHACLHGYRRGSRVKRIRWLLDVATILAGPFPEPAWDTLLHEAGRHRCEGVLAAALGYAAENLDLAVPGRLIEHLCGAARRDLDDSFFRVFGRVALTPTLRMRLAYAVLDAYRYMGQARITPLLFMRWVGMRWDVRTPLAFAIQGFRRLPVDRPADGVPQEPR